ncbi:hypothetical protein PHISCL_04716 [Aspergillus sclerotialis]|uniref:rRNA adenine N(6)-methyltransferase n=1 Tax=Aspergillus sclerotialis TaxID=2070753 RepID=A0A3A2ZNG2_9EURO|nr:hypothetical protein PHISCL_04716 [Aspergillus sclerotialis]
MKLPQTLPKNSMIKELTSSGKFRTRANKAWRADILSKSLCDDILQRLSPYLRRNGPVDIIDLWPGAGVWSSEVNNFLRPRQHILVEPDTKEFQDFLKPLAKSKSCYKYLEVNPWVHGIADLISKYLPKKQIQSNGEHAGTSKESDTLLILVNPPLTTSRKQHFLPARWWSRFIEDCMNFSTFNNYGRLQAVASFPRREARSVIPHAIPDRRRPAILTEAVASHAFEIAATHDPGTWSPLIGWDLTVDSAAHVARKTKENNVIIPTGREPIPIPVTPEVEYDPRRPCPYAPRAQTEQSRSWLADMEAGNTTNADALMKKRAKQALYKLRYDNRATYDAYQRAERVISIDQLVRRLSRDAANPNLDFKALKPLDDKIEELKTAVANEPVFAEEKNVRIVLSLIDSNRCARYSGNFDRALLAWDRRPFEPLLIDHEELFPSDGELAMFYFEADINSSLMKGLKEVDPMQRDELLRIFDAFCFSIGTRGLATVGELLSSIFADQSINDIVKAVPSLATFASKRLKSDFDNLPKTLHTKPSRQQSGEPLDPVECFQENLDYDLSDVRVRSLSVSTLWDLAVEYQKRPSRLDTVELNRAVGSSLTSFRSGHMVEKQLH